MFQVVDTDNFGSDYPDEKFVMYSHRNKQLVERLANVLNDLYCYEYAGSRFYKVVELPYKLSPGFEP